MRYIVLSHRPGHPPVTWSAPDAAAIRDRYQVRGRTLATLTRAIAILDDADVLIMPLPAARRYARRDGQAAAAVARELATLHAAT